MVTDLPVREKKQGLTRARRLRRATGRILPTLATLGNLICGFAAVYYAAKGGHAPAARDAEHIAEFTWAGWMIFLAMFFDGLDGRLARITRSTSDLGAQLDSLADVVSFGVAPAFLMLQVMIVRIGEDTFHEHLVGGGGTVPIIGRAIWVIGAIFACCAALRLARFNVETTADEASHFWFKGLPTPGAAAGLASLVLLMEEFVQHLPPWTFHAVFWILPPAALVGALLMVSNVPYPHGTNHFIRGRHPFRNLVLTLLAIGLGIVFKQNSIAVCSLVYLFTGPLVMIYRGLFAKDTRSVDDLAAEVVDEEDEEPENRDEGI